nr:hypothetical protein [Nostoc sp. DedSLP05]MDZ8097978.1 hypothetical protein [Nostoc sp. DedSLP01]
FISLGSPNAFPLTACACILIGFFTTFYSPQLLLLLLYLDLCVHRSLAKGRGGFGFRQNRGGVTRMVILNEWIQNYVMIKVSR